MEHSAIVRQLRDALAPGSYHTAIHVTTDGQSPDAVAQAESTYETTPTPIYFRDHAGIARFFDGFEFAEPGLVSLDRWRPDPRDPSPGATGWIYGAVGRKS